MVKCYTSPIFLQWFWHANLVSSYHGSKYSPKIWLNKIKLIVFFEYEHLKRFVSLDDDIFAYKQIIENQAYFQT